MTTLNAPGNRTEEAVEAALEATGWPWTKRGEVWAISAHAGLSREVLIRPVAEGVRVEAVLVEWESGEEAEAVAQLLGRAQDDLREVRCEREGSVARLAADVPAGQIDEGLPRTVKRVAVALRLLAREAAALLNAEAARAYLAFHAEKNDGN